MKKIEWSYARILLFSILIIFIVSLMSCEKEEINCDCEKITYRLDNHSWTNEDGFIARATEYREFSREKVECQEEEEKVFLYRDNVDDVYYDVICK